MTLFNWTCPFCSNSATIRDSDLKKEKTALYIDNIQGPRIAWTQFIVCPNPECREFSLEVFLYDTYTSMKGGTQSYHQDKFLKSWNLIPSPSKAKMFPRYIPKAIRKDYEEACLIKDMSPKASATLSRRCLQGMIRDFWKVKKATLFDEIEAIKNKVELQTWQAIDAVREVGNIGAHMQKDVSLIIDIHPKEAKLLINLIEDLMKDWYINRHEREKTLKKIIELGKDKKNQKKSKPKSS